MQKLITVKKRPGSSSAKRVSRVPVSKASPKVVVQISTKYRCSFNALAFGEIKPYSDSLKDGRPDLVYYRDPGLNVGDQFPLWTLH
jgi:hypothetical protein